MVHEYYCNVAKGSKFVTDRCICNLHLREGMKKRFLGLCLKSVIAPRPPPTYQIINSVNPHKFAFSSLKSPITGQSEAHFTVLLFKSLNAELQSREILWWIFFHLVVVFSFLFVFAFHFPASAQFPSSVLFPKFPPAGEADFQLPAAPTTGATNVYHCEPIHQCEPIWTNVYPCEPMRTNVCHCERMCAITLWTNSPIWTNVNQCVPLWKNFCT